MDKSKTDKEKTTEEMSFEEWSYKRKRSKELTQPQMENTQMMDLSKDTLTQPITGKWLKFLEEYQNELDEEAALKKAKLTKRHLATALSSTKPEYKQIQQYMMKVQKAWSRSLELNAKMAGAKHLDLLDKLESDYDASDVETRAKFASTLARMSETSLRASGLFGKADDKKAPTLNINIDLTSNAAEPPTITIEPEDTDG